MIQVAALVSEKDQTQASQLLEEALTETRRIDASTPERAYCLVAVLGQFAKLNKPRSWELMSETVKAANAVPDFTGENGHTSQLLEGKFSIQMGTELVGPTELPDLFVKLAEADFYQAINAAKSFSGDAPRALVTISIARAEFEAKKPDRSAKRDSQ